MSVPNGGWGTQAWGVSRPPRVAITYVSCARSGDMTGLRAPHALSSSAAATPAALMLLPDRLQAVIPRPGVGGLAVVGDDNARTARARACPWRGGDRPHTPDSIVAGAVPAA